MRSVFLPGLSNSTDIGDYSFNPRAFPTSRDAFAVPKRARLVISHGDFIPGGKKTFFPKKKGALDRLRRSGKRACARLHGWRHALEIQDLGVQNGRVDF